SRDDGRGSTGEPPTPPVRTRVRGDAPGPGTPARREASRRPPPVNTVRSCPALRVGRPWALQLLYLSQRAVPNATGSPLESSQPAPLAGSGRPAAVGRGRARLPNLGGRVWGGFYPPT